MTAKINRAVFQAVETTPDVTLAFDDFWAFAVDAGKPDGGVDPVLRRTRTWADTEWRLSSRR